MNSLYPDLIVSASADEVIIRIGDDSEKIKIQVNNRDSWETAGHFAKINFNHSCVRSPSAHLLYTFRQKYLYSIPRNRQVNCRRRMLYVDYLNGTVPQGDHTFSVFLNWLTMRVL